MKSILTAIFLFLLGVTGTWGVVTFGPGIVADAAERIPPQHQMVCKKIADGHYPVVRCESHEVICFRNVSGSSGIQCFVKVHRKPILFQPPKTQEGVRI